MKAGIARRHVWRFGGRWSPVAFYGVMVLYIVIGVTPFVLMVTGLLMYWNRSFVKKWRRSRAKVAAPARILAGRASASGRSRLVFPEGRLRRGEPGPSQPPPTA